MVEIFSEGETKYISEVSKRRDLDGRGDGEGRGRFICRKIGDREGRSAGGVGAILRMCLRPGMWIGHRRSRVTLAV